MSQENKSNLGLVAYSSSEDDNGALLINISLQGV